MNIYDLTVYVNQDVDDTFEVEDITRWFNKSIAQYNLLSPVTIYPFVEVAGLSTDELADPTKIYVDQDYPLDDTFILGVILPFIAASVRGQESSVGEKQMFLQEFMMNARLYKNASNPPAQYLKIQSSTDLAKYQVGENVYVSDMSFAPFKGDWTTETTRTPEFTEAEASVENYNDFLIQTPVSMGDFNLFYIQLYSEWQNFFTTGTNLYPITDADDRLLIYMPSQTNPSTGTYYIYKPNSSLSSWSNTSTNFTGAILPKAEDIIRGNTYFDVRTQRRFTWTLLSPFGPFEEVK